MYCYQIDCYERAIREPNQQYEKNIINCYVHLCLDAAKNAASLKDALHVYFRMVSIFEEVLSDDLLSQAWRSHSYKVFKQVKPILYEILDRSDYELISSRFDSLAEYFLTQQTANASVSKEVKLQPKSN